MEAVDAVFAALPNENTIIADPTLPHLLQNLTDAERDFTRETYFQINPAAKGLCQTARLDGTVIIHPDISVPPKAEARNTPKSNQKKNNRPNKLCGIPNFNPYRNPTNGN